MRRRWFAIIAMQLHRKKFQYTIILTTESDIFEVRPILFNVMFFTVLLRAPKCILMPCKSVHDIWPKNVHFCTVSALSPVSCFTQLLKVWLPIMHIFVSFSTVKFYMEILGLFFFNVFS